MKKLFNVLCLVLALNFLVLAGGVAFLFNAGKLDRAKVAEIRKLVFPPPEVPKPATQPAEEAAAATQPFVQLDELLAEKAGLPADAQLEVLQQTFDAKMAELDRRQRELMALKDQVTKAQAELTAGRDALRAEQGSLTAREQEAARLAADKGFQDSLKVYNSLPARQVKKIFETLDDETVVRYLRAMEPRLAAKISKEFKTPAEVGRIQKILERMRRAQPQPATSQPARPPAPTTGARPTLPQASTKE